MAMRIFFQPVLFFLSILFIFSSCTKEHSVEKDSSLPPAGTSTGTGVFTFTDATNTCTTAVINSTYQAAAPTTATNTVQLTINVSSIGTYTIATSVINGLKFTSAGTFTATGLQTITFTASGTPITKGIFSYMPGSNGCTFSINVVSAGTLINAVYTFPQAPNTCNPVTIGGSYTVGVALVATNTVKVQVNVSALGAYTMATIITNGIGFTGTGTFTILGLQSVTLTGSGNPLAAGPFNFLPGSNSCSFTITVLPAAPPATFTFPNDAAGNCTTPVIKGTYIAKQLLTNDSKVQLAVNVTVAGTYTIITNTANGITFFATGTFTATGAQQITFIGSGTPDAESTDLFTPKIAGSCGFSITVKPRPPVSGGILTCKIDGVLNDFKEAAMATIDYNVLGSQQTNVSIFGSLLPLGTPSDKFSIIISKLDGGMITTGVYNENSFTSSLANIQPVFLLYKTDTNINWGTNTNTAFTPTKYHFQINITSITATRFIGSFSGTVSEHLGMGPATKTITEGVFNVPIQ